MKNFNLFEGKYEILIPIGSFERDAYFNLRFIIKYLLSFKLISDESLRLYRAIMCTRDILLLIWLMGLKQSHFMNQPLL